MFAVLLAINAASLLSFEYPPLVDYPNHLARMFILSNPDDPVLARYYEIDWVFSPNLALDGFVRAVGGLLGVATATKLFLALSVFLLASAPAFLSRVLFGRITPVSLAGALFLHNHALQLGLMGFLFGVGLAIWCFGIHLRLLGQRTAVRIVVGTIAATILLMSHLYGFAVYAVLVGVHGLRQVRPLHSGELVVRAAQFVVPIALFLGFSPTASGGTVFMPFHPKIKILNLRNIFPYDDAWSYAFVAALAAITVFLAVRGRFAVHRDLRAAMLVLLGLYAVLPPWLLTSANADWRLLVPILFLLCGVLESPLRTRRGELAFLATLVVLTSAQALWAHEQWRRADGFQQKMIARMQALERGAKVFPAFFDRGPADVERPIAWTHLASFGVTERACFLPSLFAFATQQPLSYRGEWEDVRQRTKALLYPSPEAVAWDAVRGNFDYVVLMDPYGEAAKWERRIPIGLRPVDVSDPHIRVLAVERGLDGD